MACFHAIPAWRTRNGNISIGKELADSFPLRLPCGNCLGCRMASARAWALRCHLELQQHDNAAFTTLTYDEERLPPTLSKRHLQLFIKRFRKNVGAARPIRFFACGEYGEQRGRPHYHAIIYGASEADRNLVEETWGHGHTRTEPVTPARIAYTAGYTAKKIGYMKDASYERIDYTTGEVYQWQPPFLQMSRRPGIGGAAREHIQSWRLYAVEPTQKYRMPVPRFLHEAWKKTANEEEINELILEKQKIALRRDTTPERITAAEQIAIKKQELDGQKRKYE